MRTILLAAFLFVAPAYADDAPLVRSPSLGKTDIVFAHGGFLWSVKRDGGEAKQLTKFGFEEKPLISPDGAWIAFTSKRAGNEDVYVMPAAGGEPKQLTFFPGEDTAVAWTPDSKRIVFRSLRESYARFHRLYTVPVEGGWPEALPMWRGESASYAPDAARVAYVPNLQWHPFWKHYRGGQTTPIYLARLKDLQVEKIPRDNSNDSNPVWVGDKVYFLSDRDGPITLYAYDTKAKRVQQVLANDSFDLKSLGAGPGALVYEQFGSIGLYDLATGKASKVEVRIPAPLEATQPHAKNVADDVAAVAPSPNGEQVAVEAYGDIFTAAAATGEARDRTNTPGAAERNPAWSPDGKTIAYFSDVDGEYALHLRDVQSDAVRTLALPRPPFFHLRPIWSPDSTRLLFHDIDASLLLADVTKGTVRKIATNLSENAGGSLEPSWSPDSKRVVYAKYLPNLLHALALYDVEADKSVQLTDGLADARFPVFDRSGRALFFTISTDVGLAASWHDQSGVVRSVTRTLWRVDLKDGDLDAADFQQRAVPMPLKPANIVGLTAGKPGVLFVQEGPAQPALGGREAISVARLDLAAGAQAPFASNLAGFDVTADGEKALLRQGRATWAIVPTEAAPKQGEGVLDFSKLELRVEPRAAWKQMYDEVWRNTRDWFYAPNFHGVDLAATAKRYESKLRGVGSRGDLNYLFEEIMGEMTIGHLYVIGGDMPQPPRARIGLLGADYALDQGRYRFQRIYDGEDWSPELRAPLRQAGVTAGLYLLAVEGKELRAPADLYQAFDGTAGKPTKITVGKSADGSDARELTVTPLPDESALRLRAWEDENRRAVDRLSGGRLAYVHLPDTKFEGYVNFNRWYFAQVGKEGAVIDARHNEGGRIADFMVDYLQRPLHSCGRTRAGQTFCLPQSQIYGPKTMLINELSGSGGDVFPLLFRKAKIGKLVGTRTWGGLVSPGGTPPLLDGGAVSAPTSAHYGLDGSWEIENHGVAPDVEVENDPTGHDLQLERAVQVTLDALAKTPVKLPKPGAYPNYHQAKN